MNDKEIRKKDISPSSLTFISFQLVSTLDEGKVLDLAELENQLDYKKDIFQFLDNKFPDTYDFSILSQIEKEFLIDHYSDIHFAHGPKKFGIKNNGLGALLAYTIEIIQRERSALKDKGQGFMLDLDPSKFSGRDDSKV